MRHSLVQWQLTGGLNMVLKEQEEVEMSLVISERQSGSYSSSQGVHSLEVFPKHFIRGLCQYRCKHSKNLIKSLIRKHLEKYGLSKYAHLAP